MKRFESLIHGWRREEERVSRGAERWGGGRGTDKEEKDIHSVEDLKEDGTVGQVSDTGDWGTDIILVDPVNKASSKNLNVHEGSEFKEGREE